MATASTHTNLSDALTIRYDRNFLGKVAWSKGVLAAMIAKKKWNGRFPAYPIRVGNSPARSATFSVAKTKSENTTYGFTRVKQAQPPWVKDYGRATIEGLLMASASSKEGTFYDDMVEQIDGILAATMHSFSTKVYRDGFGCIGNIGSDTTLASTTLKLAVKEDVFLYEVGQGIQFAQSNNGHALRNSGGVLIVTAINHNLGWLTVSANIDTVTGTSLGDFIFSEGDRHDSATPTRFAVGGFDAWLPTAAPGGGENFYNLGDRNNDGRLLGTVIDTTTGTYAGASEEEALIAAVTECARVGGKPRAAFMNPTRFQNLIKIGQGRYRPTTVEGPAKIGFSGVVVMTSYGEVRVFPDLYCPRKRSFVVDLDSWTVYGNGDSQIPRILQWDDKKILRQTDDDGVECRVGYYATQGCNAPIQNAVIKHEA